ncbi:hypothetical protein FEM03_21210 [Phragmitibacter flavus]|uniref:Uncharacterized protein n=1 Tax=Phragmitibacter flavus TaxID=2576071 RepID=A0A5R8K8R2_9BACT|nr:hypothetical protein [Phragmitibacter flavus]TLD68703.1 hypothetical protein FEM03_21210 [Phragmitibacter flavus]
MRKSETASTAVRGEDFGDWLSPVLVKEFRQGLRGHWFAWVFVWVSLSMAFLVGFRGLVGEEMRARLDWAYWLNMGLVLHGAPLVKGMLAIDEDLDESRLPLLRMAGYSADWLLGCKWVSMMVQAVLLGSAMLPYALARYYTGGVDLVKELMMMGWMVFGVAAVAGVANWMMTMTVSGRVVMGVLLLIFVPLFEGLLMLTVNALMAGTGGGAGLWEFLAYVAMWLVGIGVLFVFCMSVGAAKYDSNLRVS